VRLPTLAALVLAVACAPAIDGPREHQAAVDRADAARLTAQLLALPGVVHAEVVLHRPIADPLTTLPAAPPTSSIVLVVDDRADRARLEASSKALARALAPASTPTVVIDVGAIRPELATVGPFTVAASSKSALKIALAAALAAIAALAGLFAWSYRAARR
jgi:hypothetical protein